MASMKCSSRRNCDTSTSPPGWQAPSLNEVQFPKELRQRHVRGHLDRRPASMKCSSQRNCDGPLSIARHHAHLRRLRERSALGLPLSHPTPHPTSQIPRRFNVLPLRALPGILEHRSARIRR